jgi:hypothetical protein
MNWTTRSPHDFGGPCMGWPLTLAIVAREVARARASVSEVDMEVILHGKPTPEFRVRAIANHNAMCDAAKLADAMQRLLDGGDQVVLHEWNLGTLDAPTRKLLGLPPHSLRG